MMYFYGVRSLNYEMGTVNRRIPLIEHAQSRSMMHKGCCLSPYLHIPKVYVSVVPKHSSNK